MGETQLHGSSKASLSLEHRPSPRNIKGHIPLLAGTYILFIAYVGYSDLKFAPAGINLWSIFSNECCNLIGWNSLKLV